MHDGHHDHPHPHPHEAASGALAPAEARNIAGLVACAPSSIVSREIVRNAAGTITVFAFDAGQGLSEHTAPFDAFVYALEGKVRLTIGGKPVDASAGEAVLMPANVPHAVHAVEPFKMMLVMLRGK